MLSRGRHEDYVSIFAGDCRIHSTTEEDDDAETSCQSRSHRRRVWIVARRHIHCRCSDGVRQTTGTAARAVSSAGIIRGRGPGTAALPVRPEVPGRDPGWPFGKKVGASPGAAVDFTARVGQSPVSPWVRPSTTCSTAQRPAASRCFRRSRRDSATSAPPTTSFGPMRSCGSSLPPAECGRTPRGSSGSVTCIRERLSILAMKVAVRQPRIWATSRRASAREAASRSGSCRGAALAWVSTSDSGISPAARSTI